MGPGLVGDLRQREVDRQRLAVRLLGGHRVECVGDGEDARRERDLLGLEAARVAGAVPLLVVRADHLAREPIQVRRVGDDPLAEPRMLADLVQLAFVQRPLLEQDRVRHGEHADVVEPEAVLELRVGR